MKKKLISSLVISTIILSVVSPSYEGVADTSADIANQEVTIANAQSEKDKAQSQVDSIQIKIDNLIKQQKNTKKKIEDIKNEARALNQQIENLSQSIADRTNSLEAQARSAQVNNSSNSSFDTVINSKSLTEAIQRITAIATVSSANKQMIDEQIKEQKALNKTSDTVKQNYNQYENLKKNLDAQANDLSTQQANLRVETLNYQATIEAAQDKKAKLIKQRIAAEEIAKKEAEKVRKVAEVQAVAEETYKQQTRFVKENVSSTSSFNDSTSTGSKESSSTSTGSKESSSTSTDSKESSDNNSIIPPKTGTPGYNPYAGGGCTDYVWQFFAAKGIYIANIVNGNGGFWGTNGVTQGVLRRTALAPGVIASGFTDQFTGYGTSTTSGSSPYGHVAVVTAVHPDGTFDVQEAGYGGAFPWGNVRKNLSPQNVIFTLPN
ncbi:Surface antigen (plasmid) [Lactococcus cremoris subsp. cremoris SK11]|uniref:Surface antigen n=2 Tax=Lactococcus lactis subsp. cremoris TaxID=1359 RepID=Q02VC4_LACLS|nr:CHAP domain-containing protein [Lactococcus cremoris]ABJ74098.1 Surface antigen [Lactococcus cremoris subsp. cremoris SK11]ARE22081.1 CHAP domain-containing protein [Lactococcus cremoris]KZK45410.1 Secreted antigen GbpB/SagA/PcsB putative peptidoglycan hydrolase [Lactococcus cremoris]KZK51372.1 Secreted antigen GbpB/SagA/PcsB putative peptidoglycan hydrolase [Lactococcus cremoris]MCT4409034.1 CHAP domain-containing protein [Lactococcus cremoris]